MGKVGFIGVGVMGMSMARNLIKGGHRVRAFDINAAALETIARSGAETATSARQAAEGAEYVITMLPTGDHVTKRRVRSRRGRRDARPGLASNRYEHRAARPLRRDGRGDWSRTASRRSTHP